MGNLLKDINHINEVMDRDVLEETPKVDYQVLNNAARPLETGRYYRSETYMDVKQILGEVFYLKEGWKDFESFVFPIIAPIDDKSIERAPEKLSEVIVENKVGSKADLLQYVNIEGSTADLLEVVVTKNAVGRVDTHSDKWIVAVRKWAKMEEVLKILEDPDTRIVKFVRGAAELTVMTKKLSKFETKGKAGAFGVNVEGSIYLSTSEYELNTVYELDEVNYFKREGQKESLHFAPPGFFETFQSIPDKNLQKELNDLPIKFKHYI